ncbi:hypothetical protein SAMN05192539_100763 [Paraburkholderia diazotrophica]|uniref:Uncharacterized protein n=1 Tax=Paraburkholderia diazotrophica TaxID=667676 RepID=A0A1H6WKX3_9BURK|nr:hypothetical protein SAMN05192539_100763 [Paraburkholderia diazotrophica]
MNNWNLSEQAANLHADAMVCDMTLPWRTPGSQAIKDEVPQKLREADSSLCPSLSLVTNLLQLLMPFALSRVTGRSFSHSRTNASWSTNTTTSSVRKKKARSPSDCIFRARYGWGVN